jgi:hypothetical protein
MTLSSSAEYLGSIHMIDTIAIRLSGAAMQRSADILGASK